MKWWDDLWLNEAFAEWVSHKVLDSLNPEYYIWNDFQGGKRGALAADALTSTHPIYTPVETPDEATELFDSITYEKGCSVLRMLETFLGEESFRSGIRTYMKEFAESNAAGSDLWRHLQAASDHPVTDIMETWIKQGGYPVVAVSLEQGGGSPSLHLSQKRFFSSPLAPAESDQIWKVPVVLHYEDDAGSHETRYLLTERETTLPLDVQGELRWCYANADEIGFYRQSPDDSLLDGLLANLDKLSPLEQMGLLGDQWALVRSGGQKISRFLDTLSAMFSIKQYSVLELVAFNLDRIEDLLEEAGDETALHNFRDWVERAFRPQLDELGFEPKKGEPQNDTQSRISVISALTGDAQDREAIDRSVQFAEREAKDPASVDPNLAPLFVWTAARYGDRARQDKFVKIYQERRTNGASPQETNRYLNTLPTFRPPEAVSRVLELIDEKVIPQEATGPTLSQMLSERHSQLQAWEYLKKHWDAVRTNYGDLWVGRLVEGTGRLPAEKRDEIVAFMDKNLNGVAEMSYARALETLDQLAEFKARTRGDLIGWFRK